MDKGGNIFPGVFTNVQILELVLETLNLGLGRTVQFSEKGHKNFWAVSFVRLNIKLKVLFESFSAEI